MVRTESYSSLSMFRNCPKKYELSYIKKVPRITGYALLRGRAFHESVENGRVTKKVKNFYEANVGKMARIKGSMPGLYLRGDEYLFKVKEMGFGVSKDGYYVDYDTPDALFRGKIDEVIYKVAKEDMRKAYYESSFDSYASDVMLVEWKTGKNADKKQIEYYAMALFMKFLNAESIDAKILFVDTEKVRKYTFTRDLVTPKFQDILKEIYSIRDCENFIATANYSCPFCQVREHCPSFKGQDTKTFDEVIASMMI
jgi:hypothetical protein